ncbi:MAG: HEPN domain-containing protein [Campylobacteraceae bacterium]|nr:HEPN domain-containing protein [Campylobacteraceae bacterium]
MQQSAEKVLKSLLSRHGIKFPKSHDIEQLISMCDRSSYSFNSRHRKTD